MREFRFRVWDEQDKKMSQVVSLDEIVSSMPEELFGKYLLHPYKWQQYTGLHDKNDKEIYESDILRFENLPDLDIVEATDGGWNPFIDSMETDGAWHYEVLGNIYSNHEFLEAK